MTTGRSALLAATLAAALGVPGCRGVAAAPDPAAPRVPWRFAVVGDTHIPAADTLGEMSRAMVQDGVELALFPGDIVQSGAAVPASALRRQLALWQETVTPLCRADGGVFPLRGNHEADVPDGSGAWSSAFSGAFSLPGNGPAGEVGLTYSLVHRNALFVGLDDYAGGYHRVNLEWLGRQLATAPQPHIFVFGHEPAFRAFHDDCLDDDAQGRDAFWATLAGAGARTYLCGHDHFFDAARIDDGDGNSGDDLYQIIVGSGGGALFDKFAYSGANSTYTPVNLAHARAYGYLLVEIDGESCEDLGVTVVFKQRTVDAATLTVTYTSAYSLRYTATAKAN